MIQVAIVGASGYTGLELIRLLSEHQGFQITAITSREFAGKSVSSAFGLSGRYGDLVFEMPDLEKIAERAKGVFLCVPAGSAQEMAPFFIQRGLRVIDLSADFRFKNQEIYEKTYKIPFKAEALLAKAVYGLTEIFRSAIREAVLVGNPGCYPTSILLPLIPLLKEGLIEREGIIADSKSGTSGAGRKAENYYSFCEVNEDFKAYKVAGHRHTPEIEEKLSLFAGEKIKIVFTPHLLPLNRGILSTIYVRFRAPLERLHQYLFEFYKNEPFVEILPLGSYPRLSEVRGTNVCKIALFEDRERNQGIIISVLDNLVKGASGQAIQNMNLMFGLPEETGLPRTPLFV